MRIAVLLEYDGAAFHGWQSQPSDRSVQQVLEESLSQVADGPVTVVCAGRTDAGVHATGQVVHFDTHANRPLKAWVRGTNRYLPPTVTVRWAGEMPAHFHARFSAIARHYEYVILNRRDRPGLWTGKVSWDYRPLAVAPMQEAAATLIGEHDFSSYRALSCQAKSPVRRLFQLSVERDGEFVRIRASANGFLHHMVRNLAGVLCAIGAGDQPVSWAHDLLGLRDRGAGGVTASPDGLYLRHVDYPASFALPAGPDGHEALPVLRSGKS